MTAKPELFVDCRNTLSEGPLWHHMRQELFWFDIIGRKLYAANTRGEIVNQWQFDEPVSAAGIIDAHHVLIASATSLSKFAIETGASEEIIPLEADIDDTRSNDGRVDRAGRLWIGTMSRRGGIPEAGNIYQFGKGSLTKVVEKISIPNAICFSPDGKIAYWADTTTDKIMTAAIDPETGNPTEEWKLFTDTSSHRGQPDGAVTDSEGYVWSARWGGSCVVRHAPDGSIDQVIDMPVSNITCPAFGGADLKTLYLTTAREGLSEEQLAKEPHAGSIFAVQVDVPGLPETAVIL